MELGQSHGVRLGISQSVFQGIMLVAFGAAIIIKCFQQTHEIVKESSFVKYI